MLELLIVCSSLLGLSLSFEHLAGPFLPTWDAAGTQLIFEELFDFFAPLLASVLMPFCRLFKDLIFSILWDFVCFWFEVFSWAVSTWRCGLFWSSLTMLAPVSLILSLDRDLGFRLLEDRLIGCCTILLGNVSIERQEAESCRMKTDGSLS